MTEVLNTNDDEEDLVLPNNSYFNTEENFPDLKQGIKLPKSSLQWSIANDFEINFFKSSN